MLNRGAIDKIKISELFIGKADGLKEAQEKILKSCFIRVIIHIRN